MIGDTQGSYEVVASQGVRLPFPVYLWDMSCKREIGDGISCYAVSEPGSLGEVILQDEMVILRSVKKGRSFL